MAEMVGAELGLEAIGRVAEGRCHDAGIDDDDIKLTPVRLKCRAK